MKKLLLLPIILLSLYSCQKDDIYDLIDNIEVTQTDEIIDNSQNETNDTNDNDKTDNNNSSSSGSPFISINSSTNIIPNIPGATYQITDDTLYNSHGTIYYEFGGDEYLLFPGFGFEGTIKGNPLMFKRVNNTWKFFKRFENIGIEGIRNHRQIDEHTYLLAEASENSPEAISNGAPIGRPSNIWIVKLLHDDAEWIRVNTTSGYYHDASFGDINGDGLLDVVAAGGPGQVFIQNTDGSFNEFQDVFPMQHGAAYFSIEAGELYGDSTPEIVWTSYIDGGAIEHLNSWIILKWDESTNTFYEDKRSNDPRVFHPTGDMGGNYTRIIDIDKDGNNDMIISREGEGGSYQGSVEIWLGDGNGNFEPKDMETNNGGFYAVDISLLDVNNDGYEDIVFGTEREGSIRVGPRWEQGFILNELIRINNGDGTFHTYNNYELRGGEGTVYEKFMPFMRKGNLMFIGTFTESDALFGGPGDAKAIIYEATLTNIF
jgi:hypothetical protein